MGVKLTGFLLSAALPHDTSSDWWSAFCDGLAEVAHAHQVVISGGDTVLSDGVMTLTVTAWGRREGERVLQRDGARVGDRLMLYPGAGVGVSAAGLSRWINLQSEDDWPAHQMDAIQDESIIAHLRPQPPLWAGPWALVHGASAGMDCSDGLIQDIRRLGLASNVGFRVDLGTLEEDPRCGSMSRIERAAGGEDYGLIVTVPEEKYVPFRTRGFTSLGLAVEPLKAFNGSMVANLLRCSLQVLCTSITNTIDTYRHRLDDGASIGSDYFQSNGCDQLAFYTSATDACCRSGLAINTPSVFMSTKHVMAYSDCWSGTSPINGGDGTIHVTLRHLSDWRVATGL